MRRWKERGRERALNARECRGKAHALQTEPGETVGWFMESEG